MVVHNLRVVKRDLAERGNAATVTAIVGIGIGNVARHGHVGERELGVLVLDADAAAAVAIVVGAAGDKAAVQGRSAVAGGYR